MSILLELFTPQAEQENPDNPIGVWAFITIESTWARGPDDTTENENSVKDHNEDGKEDNLFQYKAALQVLLWLCNEIWIRKYLPQTLQL